MQGERTLGAAVGDGEGPVRGRRAFDHVGGLGGAVDRQTLRPDIVLAWAEQVDRVEGAERLAGGERDEGAGRDGDRREEAAPTRGRALGGGASTRVAVDPREDAAGEPGIHAVRLVSRRNSSGTSNSASGSGSWIATVPSDAYASRLRQYFVIVVSLTPMWIASDPITTNEST